MFQPAGCHARTLVHDISGHKSQMLIKIIVTNKASPPRTFPYSVLIRSRLLYDTGLQDMYLQIDIYMVDFPKGSVNIFSVISYKWPAATTTANYISVTTAVFHVGKLP